MKASLHSLRIVLLTCALLSGLQLPGQPAAAHGGGMGSGPQTLGAASAVADAALDACTGTGKALYNCVASALDTVGNQISTFRENEKQTAAVLHTAATRLRAAVNKVQALSAISLCQSVITGAIQKARAVSSGNSMFPGWGTPGGLEALARTLAKAAALIQARG